ncbi:MAG: NAD(P)/FAD-dependent oxidoreductase [Proteobacteria bacterium]|nr:NAD(P)/FAD-dependent oxidoreductase [Pseudomonadota bacterium]
MADIVVIGGGHNGLCAALQLAKAGNKVTVLERRPIVGGICAAEEFHPGYRTTGLLHDSYTIRPALVQALGLPMVDVPPLFCPKKEGSGVLLSELEGEDAAGLAKYNALIADIRPFVTSLLDAPAPHIGEEASLWPLIKTAIGLRRLGKQIMLELMRIGPTCADDLLDEYFDNPTVKAMLLTRALPGTWMGPRSPSSTATLLLTECLAGQEVVGGPAAVVEHLQQACQKAGVDIRLSQEATSIGVKDGAVSSVSCGEETINASVVLAAIDPRQALLDLVPPLHLPPLIERDIADVRSRGTTAKVNLALSGPLEFACRTGSFERVVIGEHPLDMERAFDDVKHRRLPRQPWLDIRVPTVSQPSLAPDGHHVVSILVHCAASDLDVGWNEAQKTALFESVLTALATYAPSARDRIVGHETLTPADLDERYALRGHIYHGEHALDQLWVMRPTAALARHDTPIKGLFLGSSGTHPGGGVTCGPGLLAAQAILKG